MKNAEKAKTIIAQLEAIKAGMTGEGFEAYANALNILIRTMRDDIEEDQP